MRTSSANTSAPAPILATQKLTAGYGDTPIIDAIDVQVSAGQLVAVVGPNGAGKSTFLKAVVGLARIFAGRITVDGDQTTGQPLEALVRRGIGYVPQSQDVFGNLRVIENLEMGGYLLTDRQRRQRIGEVLDIFPALRKMTRRYVRTMSGGEQKMTAVARALMLSPRVLILDEPTAGLSTSLTQTVLQQQARQLADNGTAVLLVEQKAKLALQTADHAYVFVRGHIQRSAPAATVLRDPAMAAIFLGADAADV
jgi:ABC-type branched-subunit amino acid transport system ATPase component